MEKSKLPPKKANISHNANDFDFLYNKDNIIKCFQCGRCTSSCPAARVFEGYSPREIMRRIQDGERDDLIADDTIWLCGQCHTCSSRCPRNNDPASIILDLRRQAYKEGRGSPNLHQKAKLMLQSLWEKGVTVSPDLVTQGMFSDLVNADTLRQLRSELGLADAEAREIKIPDSALEEIRTILRKTAIIIRGE
jgi:heterodisulfide reductase subunit C